jgi:hypothetical protein
MKLLACPTGLCDRACRQETAALLCEFPDFRTQGTPVHRPGGVKSGLGYGWHAVLIEEDDK